MPETTKDALDLAREHLERVQVAWDDPTDWADLSLYGFYRLEACIVAAASRLGWQVPRTHRTKVEAALRLSRDHEFPDIEDLLIDLNSARKAAAYGDVEFPELDPEDVAVQIEEYVGATEALDPT